MMSTLKYSTVQVVVEGLNLILISEVLGLDSSEEFRAEPELDNKVLLCILLDGVSPVWREPPLGGDVLHDGAPGPGLGVRLVSWPDLVPGALHRV